MSKIKQIIESYLTRNQSRGVRKEFAEWLASPIERAAKQQQMQQFWDELQPEMSDERLSQAYENTCRRIATTAASQHTTHNFVKRFARVAAMLLVPIAVAALTYVLTIAYDTPQAEWCEVYAPYGETRSVELADGSHITLNSGSRLIYPSSFDNNERRVFLSGEAYADIAKDAARKFVLSADDVDILVHGTSFNVRSYAGDSEVEVALIEGSIAMTTKNLEQNSRVSMCAGDFAKLDKRSGELSSMRIPTGAFGKGGTSGNLTFINTRLSDIAKQLGRVFGVSIVIDNASLADERYYSAFVNHETLPQILAALQLNGKMRYRTINGTIHLYNI